MTSLLKNIGRKIADQRTVALYQDQEKKIQELNKEYGLNIKYVDIVREGVDLVLKEVEKQVSGK
jgi:hypothetical protein